MPRRAMTDDQAVYALAQFATGRTALSIARELGVPRMSVLALLNGRLYKDIPGNRPEPGTLRYRPRGERHHHYGKRKFGPEAQAEAKRLRAEGWKMEDLARHLGVSLGTLRKILRGRYEAAGGES